LFKLSLLVFVTAFEVGATWLTGWFGFFLLDLNVWLAFFAMNGALLLFGAELAGRLSKREMTNLSPALRPRRRAF
jgi:hypothetical protein